MILVGLAFPRGSWSASRAAAWMAEHRYEAGRPAHTDSYFRWLFVAEADVLGERLVARTLVDPAGEAPVLFLEKAPHHNPAALAERAERALAQSYAPASLAYRLPSRPARLLLALHGLARSWGCQASLVGADEPLIHVYRQGRTVRIDAPADAASEVRALAKRYGATSVPSGPPADPALRVPWQACADRGQGVQVDELLAALTAAKTTGPVANFREDLQPQFVILVGPPASGKSWFVEHVIVASKDPRGFKGAFPRFMSAPPSIRESDAHLRAIQYEAARADFDQLVAVQGDPAAFGRALADLWYELGEGSKARRVAVLDAGQEAVRAAVRGGFGAYRALLLTYYASMRGRHADGETFKREARARFEGGVVTTLRRVGDTVVVDSAGEDIFRTPFARFLEAAKAEGFTTSLVWMNAPLSLSLARNAFRAATGDREVPEEQTTAAYEAMLRAVRQIRADRNLDRYVEYRWEPGGGFTAADWERDPLHPRDAFERRDRRRMAIFAGRWVMGQDDRLSLKRRLGHDGGQLERQA